MKINTTLSVSRINPVLPGRLATRQLHTYKERPRNLFSINFDFSSSSSDDSDSDDSEALQLTPSKSNSVVDFRRQRNIEQRKPGRMIFKRTMTPDLEEDDETLWDSIYKKVMTTTDQHELYSYSLPRVEDAYYQLTRAVGCLPDEISYIDKKRNTSVEIGDGDIIQEENIRFINVISKSAFMKFEFGMMANEPFPDRLHIFTWHNLGIEPKEIAAALSSFMYHISKVSASYQYFRCVTSYLFEWIHMFPIDFYEDTDVSDAIIGITNELLEEFEELSADAFLIKAIIMSLRNHVHDPSKFTIPKPTAVFNLHLDIKYDDLINFKVDPMLLAKTYMFNGIEDLRSLQLSELVNTNWTKAETKYGVSPNLMKITERANMEMDFILKTILNQSERKRSKAIQYWIKVMAAAKKIRNFQLFFHIDGALSMPQVHNLLAEWKFVKPSYIRKYEEFQKITSPVCKSLKQYRRIIIEQPTLTLPFIGPFLSEIVAIDAGNKKDKEAPNGEPGYNINMERAYMAEVDMIFHPWCTSCLCELDLDLLNIIRKTEGKPPYSE